MTNEPSDDCTFYKQPTWQSYSRIVFFIIFFSFSFFIILKFVSPSPVRGSACARQVGSIALQWFKCAWIREGWRASALEGCEDVLRLSETSSLMHLSDPIAALECSLDECIQQQLIFRCGANELNTLDVALLWFEAEYNYSVTLMII